MAWVPTLPLLLGTEGPTTVASRSPALHTLWDLHGQHCNRRRDFYMKQAGVLFNEGNLKCKVGRLCEMTLRQCNHKPCFTTKL